MVAKGIKAISKDNPDWDKIIAESGPEIVRKADLPKDLGGVTNPGGYKNNCKDVAEATLKRWLGVDPNAIAGEKSVAGNLHDLVEQRGYNLDGITWITETGGLIPDSSGDSTDRVTRRILKKFKEGDCGMIGVSWDPDRVITSGQEDGHAFNWAIKDGQVIFWDDQPDPPLTDASKHLKRVNPNVEIEVFRMTKEAFAK